MKIAIIILALCIILLTYINYKHYKALCVLLYYAGLSEHDVNDIYEERY